MRSCAAHCWSVHVRPSPRIVSASWCGRPCSTTSRPADQREETVVDEERRREHRGGRRWRIRQEDHEDDLLVGDRDSWLESLGRGRSSLPTRVRLFVGVDGALHEPVLVRDARRLGPVLHPELAVDVGQVELDGLRGDPELLGDLVVREPARERAEDRDLPLRQARAPSPRIAARSRDRSPCARCPRAPAGAWPASRRDRPT